MEPLGVRVLAGVLGVEQGLRRRVGVVRVRGEATAEAALRRRLRLRMHFSRWM
jgi:hypothetical protein